MAISFLDCGTYMNGFVGDHAYTFEVGEVAPETKAFQVTKESLYKGIAQCIRGKRIGIFLCSTGTCGKTWLRSST